MTNILNALADECHKIAIEHGWWDQDRPLAELLMNFHAEISELWESYRDNTLTQPCDKGINLTNQEEEIADLLIRLLDMCSQKGVDVDRSVSIKMEYNRTRTWRHGGKLA